MGIYNTIAGPVRQSLNMIFSDTNLTELVTFKKYTGQAWSDEAEATVNEYAESSVKAVRLQHTHKSLQALGMVGRVEAGQFVFLFQIGANGLTVKPTERDIILDAFGVEHNIIESTDVFQFAYVVNVEGS